MSRITRRQFLATTAGGAAGVAAFGARAAGAQSLDPYQKAKVNWRQVEGEAITIVVTPAHYFNKFRAVAPDFTRLTGVQVKFEIIPSSASRKTTPTWC